MTDICRQLVHIDDVFKIFTSLRIFSGTRFAGNIRYKNLKKTGVLINYLQGSLVPAQSMHLSPVDRIFTRIGASDKIMCGRETVLKEKIRFSILQAKVRSLWS